MEEAVLGDDLPLPPTRLFERLSQIPAYTWDQSFTPFHSSYDHWHVYGLRHYQESDSYHTPTPSVTTGTSARTDSARSSPKLDPRPSFRHHWSSISEASTGSEISSSRLDPETVWTPVIGRIGSHILRLEREFNNCKQIIKNVDPECLHSIRPIEMFRLPSIPGDTTAMLVTVYEAPGKNYLRELVNFGPAAYGLNTPRRTISDLTPGEQVPLQVFLDFAIGACECLEMLHHGVKVVHGEVRADAFHWNRERNSVKLANAGNGPRSFENLLSSEGWSTLSRELGVKNKLQFVAPEQTGRLPAEPDSRTDIYSLGILFWTMLTGKPAFDADMPIDIVQKVLSTRLPTVSSLRMDVPDVISHIITRMTQKQMDERYHSISGLKYDLTQIAKFLGEGDQENIKNYKVGKRDVSAFFILPSKTFGRHAENDRIFKIIEKVHKRHTTASNNTHSSSYSLYSTASNSSLSESRLDAFDLVDGSDTSSSTGVKASRSNSTTTGLEGPGFGSKINLMSMLGRNIAEPRTTSWESSERESQFSGGLHEPFSRRRNTHKYKQRGKCEVITLLGAQGVGKTHLIKSVQPDIRRHGYFALARFDRARPTPFEPLIKIMASLFRQIFSERDVGSNYHELVRSHVRPIWGAFHTILDLPDTLLDSVVPSKKMPLGNESINRSSRIEPLTINSATSAGRSSTSSTSRESNDFLRGPTGTKSIRFINTYVDVLRVMCANKLICVCLDDLHVADEESIELVLNIIKAKIPLVLLLSSRYDDGHLPAPTKKILDLESANRIELHNLRERHVFEYVAATLSQDVEAVIPLAAVVHEKSAGNPFLMREILQTCYQKDCLWYDWRVSGWQFDLDRVFNEFASEKHGCLTTQFITNRLQDLPVAARSILAWASLIGNAFSFSLIQKLLSGKHLYNSGRDQSNDVTCPKRAKIFNLSESDCVEGLQVLLNQYILIPGESDDEYRFSHARYLRAANSMRECHNTEKMHFIISTTMIEYLSQCRFNLYPLARHVCLSWKIIKQRVLERFVYRDVLVRGAKKAAESGAHPTALWYYKVCIYLLQDDRWNEDTPDVFYDETLQLYVHTAEQHSLQGEDDAAIELLTETFVNGKSAADKVRSWILWSRIHGKRGDFAGAFYSLRCSLGELGLPMPPMTQDQCDIEFNKLRYRIRNMDRDELVARPLSEDRNTIALGTIMSEALSAAYWSDISLWYQLVIEFVNAHLDRGTFVQCGVGFVNLAMLSVARFKDIELGLMFGDMAQQLFSMYDDPWTRGRGYVLLSLFILHLQTPLRNILPVLESALDYSLNSGDKTMSLQNLGAMAMFRFWTGQDLTDVEAFCMLAPEEFEGWQEDIRGGVLLIATRQICRALQGKTGVIQLETLLDDESHQKENWLSLLAQRATNTARTKDLYSAITLSVYYHFGHHQYVVDTGRELISNTLYELWTNRPVASVHYYMALSLAAIAHELPKKSKERESIVEEMKELKKTIDLWGSVHNENYAGWSFTVAAEIAFISCDYVHAVSYFENAIDHSQVHGFSLDEAVAIELQAEFLMQAGAKRAGKVMIQEAIAAWNRINAVGKSRQLAEKHEWLLKTATTARTMDIGVQTIDIASLVAEESPEVQNKRDYTKSWVAPCGPVGNPPQDVPGLGLDILDLTSILEFSRVISSELQINALLSKMTSVILECVGGQAEFCAIVIDSEDQGWCVAASGDHDTGVKTYPDGIPFAEVDDQVAQQITHYILRTKETIFLQNVLEDERFSNVSEAYLSRHPSGRAIIAIPIIQADHLMGIIHLEGRPSAFTQRNMVVLNLLTNQVSISLGNALLYRKVRKVSQMNASMVESQKRALAAARDAEAKAKKAEAEAMHSVKLKEEAAKAKSIFLANVSHELRTPLNGVIGMSELLKGTPLSKDQEGYADSIRVCADTLLTVINDILDFSKLEAGKMQMFTVPVNLKETITEVVRALAYTNHEHGLETIEDLALDDNLVLGDPVRLHQIFMNLLSNAYKFTPKGSVTVKARKVADNKDRVKITCSVADTGIGITQEQLTRLFQPFSQADSSTARSYGGSGLGLSICKAMIENVLGGNIWIESTPGVGTTVFFTLAFKKAPKDSSVPSDMKISAKDPDPMANWSQSASPGAEVKASFCDLSKVPQTELRVCIAEDNAINRKIAMSFVNKLGFKCEAFEDGKLAYEALKQRSNEGKPFHIVLMDVQMPVLDGYEATMAIRKDEDPQVREVLIIALTASAIRGDREKCLEVGMNDYLAKPVRQIALRAMLDSYLSKRPPSAIVDGEVKRAEASGDKANGSSENLPNGQTNGVAPCSPKGEAKKPTANGTTSKRPTIRSRSSRDKQKSEALSDGTNRSVSPPSGVRETEETSRASSDDVSPKTVRGLSALMRLTEGDEKKLAMETKENGTAS